MTDRLPFEPTPITPDAAVSRALVIGLLGRNRFRAPSEALLQEAIAKVFTQDGIAFEREVSIGGRERIDFLVDGVLGLEIKVDGSLSEITRQLHRYAQCERIRELVLATTRTRHRSLPDTLAGKPIHVLYIGSPF